MDDYRATYTLEWLNSNMHRNYPIADSAVPKSLSNQYLPSSFITDLQLVVPYVEGIDSSRFFISSIVRNADYFQVTIGYMTVDPTQSDTMAGFDCAVSAPIAIGQEYTGQDTSGIEVAAITTIPEDLSSSYTYGIPNEYAAMRGIRGTIYIGSAKDMAGIGAMQFQWKNTAIIPTCVYVESYVPELQSIRIIDDYGTDATFDEELTIRAANGIKVTVEGSTVHFTVDEAYVQEQINAFMQEHYNTVIKSINGQTAGADGNLQIVGLDCTLISEAESGHGITISNPCSKPCCDAGNVDSAEIAAALEQLNGDKTTLNNYYTDLATKVNSMQSRLSSLIASRR